MYSKLKIEGLKSKLLNLIFHTKKNNNNNNLLKFHLIIMTMNIINNFCLGQYIVFPRLLLPVGLQQINATTPQAHRAQSSPFHSIFTLLTFLSFYLYLSSSLSVSLSISLSLYNNGCVASTQGGQPLQAHRRKFIDCFLCYSSSL